MTYVCTSISAAIRRAGAGQPPASYGRDRLFHSTTEIFPRDSHLRRGIAGRLGLFSPRMRGLTPREVRRALVRALATAETLKTFYPQAKRSRSPADAIRGQLEACGAPGPDIRATAWVGRPIRPAQRATLSQQRRRTLQAIATSLIVVTLHLAIIKIFLTIGAA